MPPPLTREQLVANFWARVSVGPNDQCWEWTGRYYNGYGLLNVARSRTIRAHRFSLELKIGRPVGKGLHCCHRCNNPRCVNPRHLYEGTAAQNSQDGKKAGSYKKGARVRLGERNYFARLTADQAREIRRRASSGERLRVIAKDYNVAISTVSAIKTRQNWRHI